MKKEQMLAHWEQLPANQPVRPQPVAYGHEGSTFDEDGIRITGSAAFIDSVLSRMKDLLDFEDGSTRLQVVYQASKDKKTGRELDAYNCYIQVHKRGGGPPLTGYSDLARRNAGRKHGSPKAASVVKALPMGSPKGLHRVIGPNEELEKFFSLEPGTLA